MSGAVLRTFLEIGYFGLVVGMILLVLLRKREAQAALGWILAIVFLPGIGMLLFLCFGIVNVPRRLRRKRAQHLEFPARLRAADGGAADAMTGIPEPDEAAASGWQGIDRIALELEGVPRRAGNRVRLLKRGEEFDEIFASMEVARHHVHVESFIFRHDGLGTHFIELLSRKARSGVEVRLLVDAFGSIGAWRLLRRLERAGGHGAVFMPLLPLRKRFAPNLRNHRKLVVCDGSVGFLGGLNIGEEYLGRRSKRRHWCDAHMKVEGPAACDLQRVFIEDWDFATGELLAEGEYISRVPCPGVAPVQIVSSGPDRETNPIHQIYFTAMALARRRLLIVSPYIVPTQGIRDAILSAALRNVEVTILTQGSPPDYWVPYWAASFLWETLLEAGVRIFHYRPGMMHAKVIVVDGAWASVGSANLDHRSLTTNFELIGVVDGGSEVAEIEARFRRELEQSDELRLEDFRRRSRWRRAAEVGAHLLAPLL